MKIYLRRFYFYITGVHYVYIYFDPDTSIPFYVGKGKNNRDKFHLREKYKSGQRKNYSKINKIQSLLKENKIPLIQRVCTCISEKEAYHVEAGLINFFGTVKEGTGPLLNIITNPFNRFYENVDSKIIYKKISESLKKGYEEGKYIPWQKGKKGIYSKEKNPRYGDHRTYEEIHGKEKSDELKKIQSKSRKGNKNPRALKWKFISPQGEELIVIGNCKNFCLENDISMTTLKKNLGKVVHYIFNPSIKYPNTEGWKLEIML